jgi:hypothetical protein
VQHLFIFFWKGAKPAADDHYDMSAWRDVNAFLRTLTVNIAWLLSDEEFRDTAIDRALQFLEVDDS